MAFCFCGCGQETKMGKLGPNKFIHGHNVVGSINPMNNTESRKKIRINLESKWNNDLEYKKRMLETFKSEGYKNKMSQSVKKALSNPDVKNKISKGVRNFYSQPGMRLKKSEESKKMWENPEYRKMS